jgi:hypothetical protein
MQDGWGETDGPVPGTRHPSWEEEDDGGVWNTASSQGSASSHNSASWGQGGKKQMKVPCFRMFELANSFLEGRAENFSVERLRQLRSQVKGKMFPYKPRTSSLLPPSSFLMTLKH